MACLVSLSLSLPFRASQIECEVKMNHCLTPYKVSLRKTAVCHAVPNLSSLANKNSVELTSLKHANRSVYYKAMLCYCQDMFPSRRHLPGCASCFLVVDQNAQTIISGYWSGPDIEDGWGFVEAYVDQTSSLTK